MEQDASSLSAIHLISGPETDDVVASSRILAILRNASIPASDHSWRDPGEARSGLMNCLSGSPALLIVLDQVSCPWLLDQVTAMARDTSAAVLRVAVTGLSAEVGPQFRGRYTACLQCLRRSIDEEARAEQVEKQRDAEGSRNIAAVLGLLRPILLTQIAGVLDRVADRDSHRSLVRVSLPGARIEQFLVVPYQDCAICSSNCAGPSGPSLAQDFLTDVYEWQMEKPPVQIALSTRASHPPGWLRDAVRESSNRFTGPRVLLPSGSSALATLLRRTGGLRGPGPPENARRWAPSAGNLGSVALYLVPGDGDQELGRAAYRYDEVGHALFRLSYDHDRLESVLAAAGMPEVSTAVILTGSVGKLALKYGRFAYRLALLDAGCAVMQLAAAAAQFGISVCCASYWGSQLAGLLGLDRRVEVVTAVAWLTSRDSSGAERACR